MSNPNILKVGLVQMTPVWLNREKTIAKIINYINEAGRAECELVVFGEALLPGYPFWLSVSNGAVFNDPVQKEIHAHYLANAIQIEAGDLDEICAAAKQNETAVYLGTIERPEDRGGHSLYCSLVYIDKGGRIQSIHRKLQPTYEERLCWSPGDGHGLRVHPIRDFRLGGLNCWENWMPLSRTALYAMGENVHIAVWPGAVRNTVDITRFIAVESRSWVISVSGLMRRADIPEDIPYSDIISANAPDVFADGGSCIAAPDGSWLLEPIAEAEGLFTAQLDIHKVWEERQNFDPAGHYSRPDVTRLVVDRKRQSILDLKEE